VENGRKWIELILSFVSGIGVVGIGALVTNILTKRRDRTANREKARLDIYMDLAHLYSIYFWVASAEVRKVEVPADISRSCPSLAWKIADKLRAAGDLTETEQILEVLFSDRYESAMSRYGVMGEIIKGMGKRVNPRYSSKMSEIGDSNLLNPKRSSFSFKSHAPGTPFGPQV